MSHVGARVCWGMLAQGLLERFRLLCDGGHLSQQYWIYNKCHCVCSRLVCVCIFYLYVCVLFVFLACVHLYGIMLHVYIFVLLNPGVSEILGLWRAKWQAVNKHDKQ